MVTPVLLEKYDSKILKALFWFAVNLFSIVLVFVLYLIKPFKFIKISILIDDKIGHLAGFAELFLRRIKEGALKAENGVRYILITSENPPNAQLFKMFKRELSKLFGTKLKIIQIPQPNFIQAFFRAVFSSKSIFGKSVFYQPFFTETYYASEFTTTAPALSFTHEEEELGEKLLRKMGIKKGSFICFHNRDSTFLKRTSNPREWSYYDYRNCDVDNYLLAAQYIASKGHFAVRMGQYVFKKLPRSNRRIIDYASKYRDDFLDIYLPAKCKFFLGSTSGLSIISEIFNRPVANANFIPMQYIPLRAGDLFIPKKIWSKTEKHFLTFGEMLRFHQHEYPFTKDFERAGLVPVENTPEEILDLAKEMTQRLDGKFRYTKEDEQLQKKFWAIFKASLKSNSLPYMPDVRIGAKFLRENKNLLK